jgi:DNA-binding CsgD family transcriptional regulator
MTRINPVPPLPVDADHWAAIVKRIGLSAQQAKVLELTLRGQSVKQIARIMGIAEPTIKTYQERIATRTGTSGRMQLAMHVLAVSHQVNGKRRSTG